MAHSIQDSTTHANVRVVTGLQTQPLVRTLQPMAALAVCRCERQHQPDCLVGSIKLSVLVQPGFHTCLLLVVRELSTEHAHHASVLAGGCRDLLLLSPHLSFPTLAL